MKFEEAYKKIKEEKKKMKLPEWNDMFLFLRNSRIKINKNGKLYNLKTWTGFSLKYLTRTDWRVIE